VIYNDYQARLTSGKFSQILPIALRTSNCVSVKPLVFIRVFDFRGFEIENALLKLLEHFWIGFDIRRLAKITWQVINLDAIIKGEEK
jgi:hypothetical protein